MRLNRPTFLSIKHGLRLYHTIRYLKWQQISYRFYYPIKRFLYRPAAAQAQHFAAAANFDAIDLPRFPQRQAIYNPKNHSFLLLNQKVQLGSHINWDHAANGRLWSFHLHYFDWLNDPFLDVEKALDSIIQYIDYQFKSKINKHSYPASIRIVNWIKFCTRHRIVDPRITASLYEQSHRLAAFPEYEIMGNHLLENGIALVWAGLYLGSSSFLENGRSIVAHQLPEQILSDGAHFERSPSYASAILKNILELLFLLRHQNAEIDLSKLLEINSSRILSHLFILIKGAPFYPNFNDSNEQMAISFPDLVGLAQHLGIAYDELALGESGFLRFDGNDFHVIFNSGRLNASYQPGHAHADAFTFILNYKGAPIIVDPGVSVYEVSERRLLERSTGLHNTVSVEGANSVDVWSSFRLAKRCVIKTLSKSFNDIEIEHDGYLNKYKITHNRQLTCSANSVQIIDRLIGWNGQSLGLHLHFHPSVIVEVRRNNMNDSYVIINDKIKVKFKYVYFHIENYQYCLGFNQTQTAQRLVGTINNHEAITIIEF